MSAPIEETDLEQVIRIARAAGDLILEMQSAGLQNIQTKSSVIDIVTEADLASEKLIRAALTEAYPHLDFWGEESNEPPAGPCFWVVDPIDGTVNYANSIPYFAVNIALIEDARCILAVTLELPLGRVYHARAGRGAFCRSADGADSALQVSDVNDLRQSILSTGFAYDRDVNPDNNNAEFSLFMPRCRGIRRMGSAAIDLALVACGSFAAHWERNLNAWDVAPGALLIQEAGGRVTDYAGRPWTLDCRNVIASNGQPGIHDELVSGFGRLNAGR